MTKVEEPTKAGKQGVAVVANTKQERMDALMRRIESGRNNAADLLAAHTQSPVREAPQITTRRRAYAISGGAEPMESLAFTPEKGRIESMMRALNDKKLAAEAAAEPQLADTGSLSPTPKGLPSQPPLRVKAGELT